MARDRRDTKKWQRENARFRAEVAAWLTERGATHNPGRMYEWRIETTAGPLGIATHDNCESIYCRFDDPQRARSIGLDCNPYTGKWNFIYFDHAANLDEFRRGVSRILAVQPVA